jgi:hypothetical protein
MSTEQDGMPSACSLPLDAVNGKRLAVTGRPATPGRPLNSDGFSFLVGIVGPRRLTNGGVAGFHRPTDCLERVEMERLPEVSCSASSVTLTRKDPV